MNIVKTGSSHIFRIAGITILPATLIPPKSVFVSSTMYVSVMHIAHKQLASTGMIFLYNTEVL